MHRQVFVAIGLCSLGLVGWFVVRPVTAAQATDAAAKLPVKRVVLFSSGVGFFQRTGEVDGSAKVDLSFSAGDINDLLKSLTLEDQGGGRVQAVGYDSRDPVERTLKSYAIDLSDNPSQAQILDRTRGEKVEVSLITGGQAIVGSIVGIERAEVPTKDGKAILEQLNVLTGEGMRSAKLSEIQRIRFLNPSLDGELRKALDTLSMGHDTAKKSVSLRFSGNGRRPVRVSYVVESPIWKTSYRLAFDQKNKPVLQGWAMIENPTDEDWSDVKMSLVSGRPISFRMDLYSPLYMARPLVEPELFASLRPPTYDGPMERDRAGLAYGIPPMAEKEAAPAPAAPGMSGGGPAAGRRVAPRSEGKFKDVGKSLDDRDQNILQSFQNGSAAASSSQLGDYFQYVLDDTISVARQKSAMVPIVNKEIEGRKVSIYNPNTHAKYPLLGLKFKNSTGSSLMQGPITIFEESTYAGDARMPDVQANEDRLISYAIDLGTEVESNFKQAPVQFTTVKVAKGILHATRKLHEERKYAALNRSQAERTLLIEHPYRAEYTLVGNTPKPAERTRDLYRFEMKLPAGQKGEIDVIEERDLDQTMELVGTDPNTILFFVRMPTISPKVKAALEEGMSLRSKWTDIQRELAHVNKQLADINAEQARLRANLKDLPPTAAAYKRYLDKFDVQETQIEKLQADQKRLTESESQARAKFEQYVSNLSVE